MVADGIRMFYMHLNLSTHRSSEWFVFQYVCTHRSSEWFVFQYMCTHRSSEWIVFQYFSIVDLFWLNFNTKLYYVQLILMKKSQK